ncbi:MAG: aminopeptidase P N-terminal domain-containing protein [Candidatus Abawacabacteria bacterium]|nr:aminopeptidase P N-terminal domain-containing protein [Candidatus Abawacabacteria bacterium]
MATEFIKRREALTQQLPPASVAIVFSNQSIYRNADTEYPFRQDSNFWYLTGFNEPQALLLIRKDAQGNLEEYLYTQLAHAKKDVWSGKRPTVEETSRITGIAHVKEWDTFDQDLVRLFQGCTTCYFDIDGKSYVKERKRVLGILADADRHGVGAAIMSIHKLAPLLARLRMYKSESEIRLMKKAAQISIHAHKCAVASLRSHVKEINKFYEYQLAADIVYAFTKAGANWAYLPIVAGGNNACTLHYTKNNAVLLTEDLCLIDAGAECDYYAADITRCYPISGTFSPIQKDIYEIVLQAQLTAIEEINKADATMLSIHMAAVKVLVAGLIDLKVLKGSIEENVAQKAYGDFFMHGTGHFLGLDVHDAAIYKDTNGRPVVLTEGMVVTVEPGLYFPKENDSLPEELRGIGIRIEDDIVKTASGIDILTQDLPKNVVDIEKMFM